MVRAGRVVPRSAAVRSRARVVAGLVSWTGGAGLVAHGGRLRVAAEEAGGILRVDGERPSSGGCVAGGLRDGFGGGEGGGGGGGGVWFSEEGPVREAHELDEGDAEDEEAGPREKAAENEERGLELRGAVVFGREGEQVGDVGWAVALSKRGIPKSKSRTMRGSRIIFHLFFIYLFIYNFFIYNFFIL